MAVLQKESLGTSVLADKVGANRSSVQFVVRKLVAEGKLEKVANKTNDPDTKYKVCWIGTRLFLHHTYNH